jgi:hypothetical protein
VSGTGIKVYWKNPDGSVNRNHDDEVRSQIEAAQVYLGERFMPHGIGVIDFADCTVIVASTKIPSKEVFVTDRKTENSILHGGFGTAP